MTEHVCLIPTHLDSHSVYFSLCVPSHLLFHHILHHLLLSASPVFSLKPIPVIPPPPPSPHELHVERTAQMSQTKHDTSLIGQPDLKKGQSVLGVFSLSLDSAFGLGLMR